MTVNQCLMTIAACLILLAGTVPTFARKRMRVPVPEDIAQELVKNGEDADLRAESVDLNDDGRPELIVKGDCAVVGNCSTWIFHVTRRGHRLLLNNEAQMVRIGKAGIRGYRDVLFQVHDSAYGSTVLTYKFDGSQYHLNNCVYQNYGCKDQKGRLHINKRPRLERC